MAQRGAVQVTVGLGIELRGDIASDPELQAQAEPVGTDALSEGERDLHAASKHVEARPRTRWGLGMIAACTIS
jgi:hypothetical protein